MDAVFTPLLEASIIVLITDLMSNTSHQVDGTFRYTFGRNKKSVHKFYRKPKLYKANMWYITIPTLVAKFKQRMFLLIIGMV